MIKINKESREFTNVEKYLLTASKGMITMKDVTDGESIAVDGWLDFMDEKSDGKDSVNLLSIITPEKKVYVTNSQTFFNSFMDIVDVMGNSGYSVIKFSGVTKSGRTYIDCQLDLDSLNV